MGSRRLRLTAPRRPPSRRRREGPSLKRALAATCTAVVAATAAAGCTTQQAYFSAQTWQRNECNKLVEQNERERCLARTNMSYDDYQRQTEDGKKP